MTNGGSNDPNIRILDVKNFGVFMPNPLKNGSDDATEDALMDNANMDVYPEPIFEAWEQCHFNLDFPKLDHRKAIVRDHGRMLFQPSRGIESGNPKAQGQAVSKLQDAALSICA